MVALVVAETAEVETVNVAVVAPAATVTVAGTVAEVLEDERETTTPPVGAASAIVSVPVVGTPPTSELEASFSEVG